ncbi:MAG: regulatory protein GemA [Nitrospinae bacterium]|nr:regulatory protein GemA [Nitrospinota bacterium]MBL7021619.1 regulatory protein GemA [Nitrospinaceae bacterium]
MSKKTVANQRQLLQTGPTLSGGPSRTELAKVHIAKRDLKLTDQLYRGVLNVLFGETSARDLSHEQIDELLDHFKSLGWGSEYTKGQATSPSRSTGRGPATMAQLGLIVYLWKHGPGIRNKSTQALEHFLSHHFHIPELKQVKARQVPGVLGAIKNMGKG